MFSAVILTNTTELLRLVLFAFNADAYLVERHLSVNACPISRHQLVALLSCVSCSTFNISHIIMKRQNQKVNYWVDVN